MKRLSYFQTILLCVLWLLSSLSCTWCFNLCGDRINLRLQRIEPRKGRFELGVQHSNIQVLEGIYGFHITANRQVAIIGCDRFEYTFLAKWLTFALLSNTYTDSRLHDTAAAVESIGVLWNDPRTVAPNAVQTGQNLSFSDILAVADLKTENPENLNDFQGFSQCPGLDLNQQGVAPTTTSTLRSFKFYRGKTRVVEPPGEPLQQLLQQLSEIAHAEGGLEWLAASLKAGLSRERVLSLIKQLLWFLDRRDCQELLPLMIVPQIVSWVFVPGASRGLNFYFRSISNVIAICLALMPAGEILLNSLHFVHFQFICHRLFSNEEFLKTRYGNN